MGVWEKWRVPLAVGVLAIVGVAAFPATRRAVLAIIHPGWDSNHRFTLPNGWRLTPKGESNPLPGDMPAGIQILDGGKTALINTCGFHDHSLNLIDLQSGKVVQSVPFKRSWVGLAVDGNDALVSGGLADGSPGAEAIHKISLGGGLTPESGFNLPDVDPKKQFVSAILRTPAGLVVLNIQTDEALLLDPEGKLLAKTKVGYRPFAAALSPDGKTLAISNWGDKSVSFLDPKTLATQKTAATRALPSALLYAPDGRLFVTESGSNTVAVIKDDAVVERVRTGVEFTIPVGASPLALALSKDSKTLYVADAGNNCVTVIDVSRPGHSRVKGLIPTERYPSAIALTPDGKRLLVSTAKGYYGPNPVTAGHEHDKGVRQTDKMGPHFIYIPNLLEGRLAMVDLPSNSRLRAWTRECYLDQPRGMDAAPSAAARDQVQHGAFDKIKHVLYVIRENRSYDQVLGDIGKGQSDPALTIFGQKVTPNGHKIANTFTLFDNLYVDGEVSQIGHQWTDSAYASDYVEKQWVLSYSGHQEVVSDPRLTSSPGDYIWTLARKHGLTARVFGEYVDVQEDHDSLQNPEIMADPEKYGMSAAFEKIFARGGRDVEKVDEFLGEMHQAETSGKWPSFMVMALPEDHTKALSAGAYSPYAMVGDNDQAVGKLLESISHSPFWKDTAVFIIEDDAQDGCDHVDAHRTVGLVVSPFVKRGVIDSTMYSTSSMLHTMELILHLPPMTQYDAKATPMYAAFTDQPDFTPYENAPPDVNLEERNPRNTTLAQRSAKLDFSDIDRAEPTEFNHILWEAYRPGEPYPAQLH